MSTHNHNGLSESKLLFSIILNLLITVSQYIGGVISGSLSLMSDATHNLTDVISLIISYIAAKLKHRKQTEHHTFGYKRAEIIAAFINASSLIILSVFLGIEAIHRFYDIKEVESDLVIWLALVAIIANTLSVFLLSKDAKDNINMRSAYVHLLSDALVSVAVLIGGFVMKYYQIYWVDPAITLVISIYLLYLSWDILLNSTKMLMLFAPKNLSIKAIEDSILQFDEIKNLHHVHLWQLNDHDIYIEAHIEFKDDIKLSQWDNICYDIEKLLWNEFKINHSMLQPEFNREDAKEFIIQD
ncbi:MAG TPA: cation transporter [Crocinitomix sp.]|nr:cation transporter [Crocinitomix sp.]